VELPYQKPRDKGHDPKAPPSRGHSWRAIQDTLLHFIVLRFDMILFECADCLTECYADEVVCSSCGADLTNEVDASDYDYDDDDGQPSEMQEWHDFDPDC
tara:strand:- start:320 stop:619 length:300 start_codon:yes stop_codon:yes gene_type:complete